MSLKMLGLMKKANALASGTDRVQEAFEKGRVKLLILPSDAPERAVRNAEYFIQGHRAEKITVPFTQIELAGAIGIGGCTMLAVTDIGFAEAFVKTLGTEYESVAEELAKRKEKYARRRNKKKG